MGTYLGKTAENSDPVTGEWHGGARRLERVGIHYIVLGTVDTRNRKKPDLRAVPTKLHRNVVEGHLGGQVFSRAMLRFVDEDDMKSNAPTLTWAEKNWWVGEAAEREMRAYFPADIVDTVLAILRDGQSWDDAMLASDRNIKEVKVIFRQMRRHCRAVLRQQDTAA